MTAREILSELQLLLIVILQLNLDQANIPCGQICLLSRNPVKIHSSVNFRGCGRVFMESRFKCALKTLPSNLFSQESETEEHLPEEGRISNT